MKKYILLFVLFLLALPSVSANLDDTKVVIISLVNQDPDPVVAGDVVEIRLGVENIGGEAATDVVVEVVPEYPFELASGFDAVEEIGTLNSYQKNNSRKIVTFKLKVNKDAPAGNYGIAVWEYQNGSRNETWVERTFDIEIKNRESTEIIFIDKTILVPGEESTMKFTVNNVGKAPLRDLQFTWSNDKNVVLPVGSGSTKYIKSLDIGKSADLNYRVIANTNSDPGLYKLDLILEYDDPITGKVKHITDVAGVYVGGGTDFDVAFSESSKGETSFNVANIGSNPAYSVSVIIPEQKDWKLRGPNSIMVGNLNSGDYTLAGFNLIPLSNNSKTPLEIEISYTDTTGKRNVAIKNVLLEISNINTGIQGNRESEIKNPSPLSPEVTTLVLVILAAIVIYMIYRKIKKRENKIRTISDETA